MAFGTPDEPRWSDLANFDPQWDERARLIAGLVRPGTHVVEFGAGRRQLERWLPPECTYVPSDLVARGPGTFVCDLNRRPLPEMPGSADIAVFAGVLEYLIDLDGLFEWLAGHVQTCIASYEVAHSAPHTLARVGERWRRMRIGWVNTYGEAELETLAARVGFTRTRMVVWETPDGDEPIFVFERGR